MFFITRLLGIILVLGACNGYAQLQTVGSVRLTNLSAYGSAVLPGDELAFLAGSGLRHEWEYTKVLTNSYLCCDRVDMLLHEDGNLYVSMGTKLVKHAPNGEVQWEVPGSFWSLASNRERGIAAIGPNGVEAFDQAGRSIWRLGVSYGSVVNWDGQLITGDQGHNLGALDPNGRLLSWYTPQCSNCVWVIEKFKVGPEGSLFCMGYIMAQDGAAQLALAKWNSNKEPAWVVQSRIGTNSEIIIGHDFAVGDDGSAAITCLLDGDGRAEKVTMRFDSQGREVWKRTTERPAGESLLNVAIDHAGATLVFSRGLFLKYDPNGAIVWQSSSGHPSVGLDEPRVVTLDPEGNIYLFMQNNSGLLEKLDAQGNSLWSTTFPWKGYNFGSEMALGTDGSIYVFASFVDG